MIIEIKVPSPGESISEVEIANWLVEDGSIVAKDQEIVEIESEKATLAVNADEGGKISILAQAGDTVSVGDIIAKIDTDAAGEQPSIQPEKVKEEPKAEAKPVKKEEEKVEKQAESKTEDDKIKVTPVAKAVMDEHHLSVDDIINGLKRLEKKDVEAVISNTGFQPQAVSMSREVNRAKMTSLRKKLSQRLVSVKNETAMLTTFNEVDMSAVMSLRKQYQKQFVDTYGIKLGFMSFFTKAVTEALKLHPNVNSYIDGEEIATPEYMDVGIAVQTDKGLMVPVVRNAESMSLAEIELKIMELATKARKARISLDEMTGGTFTITNGGIFGSMLSTPILNPPQSGILGMHNIVERPVAVNGQVEIRPMMYIALSYDHRIIDGRDSVGFLVKVKEFIENPGKMLFGAKNADQVLLGL